MAKKIRFKGTIIVNYYRTRRKEVGTSRIGLNDTAELSLGTERTRWQRELQERLTHAAAANDSAGNRLRMFCMRSFPKSSITATISRLPLPVSSFAFNVFDRWDCSSAIAKINSSKSSAADANGNFWKWFLSLNHVLLIRVH